MENLPAAMKALTGLSKSIPKPVFESISLLMAQQVDSWRVNNLYNILKKAEGKITLDDQGRLELNPKIVLKITELGSLESEDELQDMWAGLLSVSANDDTNLHYVEILGGLAKCQAKLLKYACQNAEVHVDPTGLFYTANKVYVTPKDIQAYCELEDINVLDQMIDDLRRKELVDGGFLIPSDNLRIEITPSTLALHFFAVVSGSKNAKEFYSAAVDEPPAAIKEAQDD